MAPRIFRNADQIMSIEGNGSDVPNRPLTITNLNAGGSPRWCRADGSAAVYINQTTGGWAPGAYIQTPRLFGSNIMGYVLELIPAAVAERATAYRTFTTYTYRRGGGGEILAGASLTISSSLGRPTSLTDSRPPTAYDSDGLVLCPNVQFTQDQD
jgi:hypothetical protein